MNKRDVAKANLEELISAYREAASVQGTCLEGGGSRTERKAADLVFAIYGELRLRGEESQRALLPLLVDSDPGVRRWAGQHALEFAPTEAVPVLEALAPVGYIGLMAKLVLDGWRSGRLTFP
jgi:hypothetical protein